MRQEPVGDQGRHPLGGARLLERRTGAGDEVEPHRRVHPAHGVARERHAGQIGGTDHEQRRHPQESQVVAREIGAPPARHHRADLGRPARRGGDHGRGRRAGAEQTERQSGEVAVKLSKPTEKTFDLEAAIAFPTDHMRRIIAAARAGKTILEAPVYDGSDKGEKFYETSAVIGPRGEPGSVEVPSSVANGDKLNAIASWPIAIGYFEPGPSRLDALPTYELSFRFYENGVSSRLYIDYGDFAIRGELKELTFLESGKCGASAAEPVRAPVKR